LYNTNYKNSKKLNKHYIKQFGIYKINQKQIQNSAGQPSEVVGNVVARSLHAPPQKTCDRGDLQRLPLGLFFSLAVTCTNSKIATTS